jgi:hypothetical protein
VVLIQRRAGAKADRLAVLRTKVGREKQRASVGVRVCIRRDGGEL